MGRRIGTGPLNTWVKEIVAATPPPVRGGKQPRILFATQATARPPTFVLFTTGFLEAGLPALPGTAAARDLRVRGQSDPDQRAGARKARAQAPLRTYATPWRSAARCAAGRRCGPGTERFSASRIPRYGYRGLHHRIIRLTSGDALRIISRIAGLYAHIAGLMEDLVLKMAETGSAFVTSRY